MFTKYVMCRKISWCELSAWYVTLWHPRKQSMRWFICPTLNVQLLIAVLDLCTNTIYLRNWQLSQFQFTQNSNYSAKYKAILSFKKTFNGIEKLRSFLLALICHDMIIVARNEIIMFVGLFNLNILFLINFFKGYIRSFFQLEHMLLVWNSSDWIVYFWPPKMKRIVDY